MSAFDWLVMTMLYNAVIIGNMNKSPSEVMVIILTISEKYLGQYR